LKGGKNEWPPVIEEMGIDNIANEVREKKKDQGQGRVGNVGKQDCKPRRKQVWAQCTSGCLQYITSQATKETNEKSRELGKRVQFAGNAIFANKVAEAQARDGGNGSRGRLPRVRRWGEVAQGKKRR